MSTEPHRLADLAAELGREVEGDGDYRILGVAPLESAGPGDLSFVRSAQFADALAATKAGAVIVPPGVDPGSRPAIRSPQPDLDFAQIVRRLLDTSRPPVGIDPSAQVAPDARVHGTASIGPGCSVAQGAVVGAGCVLHPNVTLYSDVRLGADCEIHSGCVLREGTQLGDRVVLQPCVALGGDGFGYAPDSEGRLQKVPQIGRVILGDDVEIGSNTSVDRGTLGDTRIGSRVKIDNLVQIAHNCVIGDDAIIVSQAGLAGSTIVERGGIIMAQAGITGHLTIGERAFVGPKSGVHHDVPAGTRVLGSPQRPERTWHKMMASLVHLPGLLRRVRGIERRLGIRGGTGSGDDSGPEENGS